MVKDVEKFKTELFYLQFMLASFSEGCKNYSKEDIKFSEQKLIKMYSELEESHEKTVIHCIDIAVFESENYQVIRYTSKNFMQQYLTMECKIKGNMYITDDFIFMKE